MFGELELQIVLFFQKIFASSAWVRVWLGVSNFLFFAVILLTVVFYVCIDREVGYSFFVSIILSTIVCEVLKFAVHEDRPFVASSAVKNRDIALNVGYSFPSGHCTVVSAGIWNIQLNYESLFMIRKIFLWIVTVLIVVARMVLGSHYLYDCVAGIIIGWFFSLAVIYFFNVYSPVLYKNNFIIGAVLTGIGVVGCILADSRVFLFDEMKAVSYLFTCLGSFMFGNAAERKFFNSDCSGRLLKKIIRFVFLLLFLAVFALIFFSKIPQKKLYMSFYIIFNMFFITFFYTYIGRKVNLYET